MKVSIHLLFAGTVLSVSALSYAGPYSPAAGQPGSEAISASSTDIIGWATGYVNYLPGDGVDTTWQQAERALGEAGMSDGANSPSYSTDIVSLGRGGEITLTFATPIGNGEGDDFAVFENSFSDTFLELAWVEVSSDGDNFFRFPGISLTPSAVGGFGNIDPSNIDGLAGKYRGGYGTGFDLDLWSSVSPELLDIDSIIAIKIVDIIGDGSELDNYPGVLGGPNPIYDPYPTTGSAGFDLDAVAVLNAGVPTAVPLPAAAWFFLSALSGLMVVGRKRQQA